MSFDKEINIQVLLSTFNGEKYLAEQLDSILNQEGVNINCLIRDDGSSDNTIEVITEYLIQDYRVNIFENGENIGFAKSFYKLVENSGNYSYYAFSDQDDIWMPRKLNNAILMIEKFDHIPCMCYCNCDIVDEYKNHICYMYREKNISKTASHAILENVAPGCTIVFNKLAKKYFLYGNKDRIAFHDYWMYVICSYLGKVIYDPTPNILYRQHQNNIIGTRKNVFIRLRRQLIQLFRKIDHPREYMAEQLLKNFFGVLERKEIEDLELLSNYRKTIYNRVVFLFNHKFKLSTHKKNIFFKIYIIIGKI